MKSIFKSLTVATLITLSSVTANEVVSQEEITKVYMATLSRVPDSKGLDYWGESNLHINDIAQSFFDQPETQALYPEEVDSATFIDSVYNNLFGREADSDGREYWVGELDSHRLQRHHAIIALINGAKGTDAELLDTKTRDALVVVEKEREELKGSDELEATIATNIDTINIELEKEQYALLTSSEKTTLLQVIKDGGVVLDATKLAKEYILAHQNSIDKLALEKAISDAEAESAEFSSSDKMIITNEFNKKGLSAGLAKVAEVKVKIEEAKKEEALSSGGSMTSSPVVGGGTGGVGGGTGEGGI